MAPSAATTEFRAALNALGLTQMRVAELFNVSPRHVRRWWHGDRRIPHAVGIVCNILTTGMLTIEQIEAVAPVPGSAKGGPPAVPAPKQSASARAEMGAFAGLSPSAAAIVALDAKSCRFPLGDPQDRDFRFCGDPVVAGPYCARHHASARLAPRTGSGHRARVGFITPGRYGRPSIPGAFSATGASRAPKILFDRAGDLPSSAPPPA